MLPGTESPRASVSIGSLVRKDLVQSPSGLGARRWAWLRTGTVSEGGQKEAIVCLPSLPQGWESSLFLSPEAKSPVVQDLTRRQASPCLPPVPRTQANAVRALHGTASALWGKS